jgi:hypothetical protein
MEPKPKPKNRAPWVYFIFGIVFALVFALIFVFVAWGINHILAIILGTMIFIFEVILIIHFSSLHRFSDWLPNAVVLIVITLIATFGLAIVVQASNEKHIAQSVLFEIEHLQPILKEDSDTYLSSLTGGKGYILHSSPYYGNNGLFYLYGKDIFNLNPGLTVHLYDFYTSLIEAENARIYLQTNCLDPKSENPDVFICNLSFSKTQGVYIHEKILHAYNEIDTIAPLLNETINRWYAFF